MKCIKEDIANIERAIENDKLNTVGAMPIVMADAVYQSEKVQEEIDKEMEKHNKEVKLNKVIGAENQPVPDLPEKPKVALDESLFEDYEELLNISTLKEDLQDERIKNAKKYLESALKALNSYLDRTTNESKECLSEGRKKEERDLFTQIMDDLSATNYNMKDKTKFPDMKLKDKYDNKSLGVAYRKDGFVDIDIREDSKEKLDFAKQVADAYGVESLDIVKEGDQYRLSIRVPEE